MRVNRSEHLPAPGAAACHGDEQLRRLEDEAGALDLQRALADLAGAAITGAAPERLHRTARDGLARAFGLDLTEAQAVLDRVLAAVEVDPVEPHLPDFLAHLGRLLDQATRRFEHLQRALSQAYHDDVTGLPNRRRFTQLVECLLSSSADDSAAATHALLLVDLDGFKGVNDTQGHMRGDDLLRGVGSRLVGCVRPEDVVARIGGDEFVVLVHTADEASVRSTVRRILNGLRRPFRLGTECVQITGSIGIAKFTKGTFEQILSDADLAMYAAKSRGRSRAVTYRPALRRQAEKRSALQRDLRLALERHHLDFWQQPIVDLVTGDWVGSEALARWTHPTLGAVPPGEFVQLAEETGLIDLLTRDALGQTLTRLSHWKGLLPRDHQFCAGLNVSARQLTDRSFVERVLSGIGTAGVEPDALVLELTESTLIEHGPRAARALAPLREAGVRIAIDDFGTGYSSLSYLARLPVDIVKLDQSFVADLGTGRREEAVVRAAITLCRDLDLVLVAEGIETRAQVSRLLELGCHLGQGYHLRRPIPHRQFETALLESVDGPLPA